MSAVNNTFGSFGGTRQFTIDANFVNRLYASIKNYTKSQLRDFMPNSNGEFPNRVVTQWYLSDFSRGIRNQLQNAIGRQLPDGIVDWEFTVDQYSSDGTNAYRWAASNSTRGEVQQGGLLGLVKNLIQYTARFNSSQLAKTAGSDNGANNAYTITVRRLLAGGGLLRGLELDKTEKLANNGKLELFTPVLDIDVVYCSKKALAHAMKIHGKDRFMHYIPDEAMNLNRLIEVIKELQSEKRLLKKIHVYQLRTEKNYKRIQLKYPDKKQPKDDRRVDIVVDNDHVWIKKPEGKKRSVDDQVVCELCKTGVEKRFLEKHKRKCIISDSRKLENIHSKNRDYPIKEYGAADLERMEDESKEIYKMMDAELRQGKSIFLIGPGGNGKTYLNKKLCFQIPGEKWVLTPTGITASDYKNIGSTWHKKFKVFQILGQKNLEYWIKHPKDLKETVHRVLDKLWTRKPRFIIFEECSMICGADFKFMSECLKAFYDCDDDFGGIPVVICGDPGQLPPISEGLADMYYSCDEVTRIRKRGVVVELNHPRRLLQGGMNVAETCRQFNIQQKMRLGQLDKDLFNVICRMDDSLFEKKLEAGDIQRHDEIVLCMTHLQIQYLIGKIYKGKKLEKVGKDFMGHDLYVTKGMKILVMDNQAVSAENVYNGTTGIVLDWEKNKWIQIETSDRKKHKIYRGKGTNVKRTNFAIGSYHVRTIHKAQGATIKQRMYLYLQSKAHKIRHEWNAGQMYTALSRCINMRNIIIVCMEKTRLTDCIKESYVWTYKSVCDVIKNPKDDIGIDTMVGDDGKIALRDTNSMTGFIQMMDKRITTNDGAHYDRYLKENELIHQNTLNIDHETREEDIFEITKQVVGVTTPRWTFRNEITDFQDFIERNGGNCDGLEMYQRHESGVMIFSNTFMDDPGMALFEWMLRIFDLVVEKIDKAKDDKWTKDYRDDLAHFYQNPMILLGFNNLGFDDRFFMQHFMMKKSCLEPVFTQAGGSNLKQFMLKYGNDFNHAICCKSYDLALICGVGSLDKHVTTSVMPFVKKGDKEAFMSIWSRLWIAGKLPEDGYILGDHDPEIWHTLDDDLKKRMIYAWTERAIMHRHYQGSDKKLTAKEIEYAEKNVSYLVRICERAGKRDEFVLKDLEKHDKKGCCALKYYTKMTPEEIRQNQVIDLMDIMWDEEKQELIWERCFFDRAVKKAKEMLKERGEDFFRNYPLYQEVLDYAINDVVLNDLLLRVKDNGMGYWFGRDLKEFEFKNSWNGLGLSILRFDTTCQYTMQITTSLMPKDCFFDDKAKRNFKTKFPTMPIEMGKIVEGICGGKTQPRRIHYQSSDGGVNDFLSYVDVSGMYMKVQQEYEYPYGHMSIWTSIHQEKLDEIVEKFERNDRQLFDTCRLFMFRGKCHPKEIENVCGVKTGHRLLYTNEEQEYCMTNYELEMFRLYSGKIIKMITVIEWEHQGKIFEKAMSYYANLKATATNDVDKANAKLLANAAFGAYNQKDKLKKMVAIACADDAHKLYDRYPSGIKNRQMIGDRMIGHVEDTEATSLRKPSYLGAFTLGGSKKLLYSSLYKAFGGDERLQDYRDMVHYGDTDSLMITKRCLDRLIQHDMVKDEKDRILFDSTSDKQYKPGKFTDELSDDAGKYFPGIVWDKSFPNFKTGFHMRVIEAFHPQSKSGGTKFLAPPTHWNDGRICTADDYPQPNEEEWLIGYKCAIKGVHSQAVLSINDEKRGFRESVKGVQCNQKTYEFLRHSYQWCIPIESKREGSIVKIILFPNKVQEEQGMTPFGIYNIEDPGRRVWGAPNNGRKVLVREGFDEKTVQEWARDGIDVFTSCDGYTVPFGFEI